MKHGSGQFHERSKNAKIVLLWVLKKKDIYLQGREKGRLKSKLKDAFKIMRQFQKSFFC